MANVSLMDEGSLKKLEAALLELPEVKKILQSLAEYYPNTSVRAKVTGDTSTYQTDIFAEVVNSQGNCISTILRCYVKPVESCCAMSFLFSFTTVTGASEVVTLVMTQALRAIRRSGYGLSSNRLIVNMVEQVGGHKDPLEVVKASENPVMMYQEFYQFFQKYAAKVNVMLMPNRNTGRIIHHMEVLFDDKFLRG